jgi:hypothetical protein
MTNIDMGILQCRNCRAVCDENFNFCGRCGLRLRDAGSSLQAEKLVRPSSNSAKELKIGVLRRNLFVTAILCLILLLATGSLLLFSHVPYASTATKQQKQQGPQGMAWFYDLHGQSDGVVISLHSLPTPDRDHVYVGWLTNPQRPDQKLSFGPLIPDTNGNVTLNSDQKPSFNGSAQDLRLLFTHIIVTLEAAHSPLLRPGGHIVLQGMLNQSAIPSITQLFITASFTPGQLAILSGLRIQMRELVRWIANIDDSQRRNDVSTVHTDLLRMLYVLEGIQGTDVQHLNLTAIPNVINGGDGVGILSSTSACQSSQQTCGYLDNIRLIVQSLSKIGAASQSSTQNVLTTLATVDQLAHAFQQLILSLVTISILDEPAHASLTRLIAMSDALLNGNDNDGDGSIDPVPGEAAAAQLYTYIQQVGAIRLLPAIS